MSSLRKYGDACLQSYASDREGVTQWHSRSCHHVSAFSSPHVVVLAILVSGVCNVPTYRQDEVPVPS
jgi:hypothetical protein|eukprot:COSAG06_NODE_1192_length_10329_cov_2.847703_5_plen_67_part_00